MTSTYADVYFKTSIKDGTGNPAEPPEDVYAQLTELVESGILKGDDGLTPYVGSNNNWWIGDIDTGVLARGTDGEDGYTPVKGVDYFTEEEIQQIQNEVSGGAIGDFKAVVDEETATFNANAENTLTGYNANAQEKFETYNANANSKFSDYNTNAEEKFSKYISNAEAKLSEYNQNDSDKTALYNANAESKLDAYDSNAQAKLDLYNQNDSKKMEAYNSNAQTKLEAYNQNHTTKLTTYDTNAEQHTTDYNSNAEQKLESYNSNHTEKLTEYNTNAETKTAEFDSNAAALQTEVDRLRGEVAEKANVDGYYEEMTVGDAEQLISSMYAENSEPYGYRTTGGSADVGNRAYLDKIVGGTVAWNQQVKLDKVKNHNGITASLNNDRSITINGTATSDVYIQIDSRNAFKLNENHKYLYKGCPSGGSGTRYFLGDAWNNMGRDNGSGTIFTATSGTFQPSIIVREGNTVSNLTFKPNLFDLTQMFGSTIADYIYSIEQSQAGAGVAWFKKLFPKDYYGYNAGELLSVEGLQSHDMVGFNQWDEEWEVGDISTSTGEDVTATNIIRSKGFMPCLPNVQYCFTASDGSLGTELLPFFYDADKQFVSVGSWSNVQNVQATPQNCHYMRFKESTTYGTTYNHDICINLSDPSRNGEYEPYEKHSYPLDSSLTLRGIPKLDASNNLYYDGDEYTSDGKVKRKYGVVVIDENANIELITNITPSSGTGFVIRNLITDSKADHYVSNLYSPIRSDEYILNMTVGQFKVYANDLAGRVIVIDSVSTVDDFKAKLKQTPLSIVYELAAPTTETVEPFQNIQVVDDFGTEEFVSTSIVPVGHKTRYPANLRDKLQHLPSLASMDGTYLVKQTDKQMSLVHTPAVFPETPTEDGTYTLKTVVTGGVATLQWVAE